MDLRTQPGSQMPTFGVARSLRATTTRLTSTVLAADGRRAGGDRGNQHIGPCQKFIVVPRLPPSDAMYEN